MKTAAVKQCPGRQSGSAGAGNVWDWPNKLKCSLFWCLQEGNGKRKHE